MPKRSKWKQIGIDVYEYVSDDRRFSITIGNGPYLHFFIGTYEKRYANQADARADIVSQVHRLRQIADEIEKAMTTEIS